jgi:hypothetical protein
MDSDRLRILNKERKRVTSRLESLEALESTALRPKAAERGKR